jgi:hypothetical protein
MEKSNKRVELARLLAYVRDLEIDGDYEWADRLSGRADAIIAKLIETPATETAAA